jgi:hypothetical protein
VLLKINKTYIRWTPDERMSVARAIRQSINAEGYGVSDLDDVKTRLHRPGFLDFLGEGRVRTAFNTKDYVDFTALMHAMTTAGFVKAADDARDFVEKEPVPTAYEVPGLGSMSVAGMIAYLQQWAPLVEDANKHFAAHGTSVIDDAKAYRTPTPAPAPIQLDVQVSVGDGKHPTKATATIHPQKHSPVVCIAGLHAKHRDRLLHEFRGVLKLDFIEQRASDSQIKSHCSGKKVVIYEAGVNGNVLRLLGNIAGRVYPCHGLAKLNEHLHSISKGN